MTGGNELLQSLSADLTALMRQEFQALQRELTNPFLRFRTGARLLGGSAVLGSMAAGGATALAIRLLDRRLLAVAHHHGGGGARVPAAADPRPAAGRPARVRLAGGALRRAR